MLESIHTAEFVADVATGGMMVAEDGARSEDGIIAFKDFCRK